MEHFKRYLIVLIAAVMCMIPISVCAATDPVSRDIEPGFTYEDEITDDAEEFVYNFELTESGTLTLDFVTEAERVKGRLTYLNGTKEQNIDTLQYIDKGSQSMSYDLAPGKYYYTVKKVLKHLGKFSITASFVPSGETYTGDNNSINEVRNSDPVVLGSIVNGQIAENDAYDYYKFHLDKAGQVTVTVHVDAASVDASLYDSSDSKLVKIGTISKGDASYSYDLAAGDYYLEFEQTGLSAKHVTGNYCFVIGFTSANETFTGDNNTINQVYAGDGVVLTKKVKGQLALNDDCDYYKVNIPKAGKYVIYVNSKVSEVSVVIYDSTQTYTGTFNHEKGTANHTVTLSKGNNYIKFEKANKSSGTGVYVFKVSPKGVALSKVTAGKKSFKAIWKKGTGNGYQLQYSTTKKFSKGVKSVIISKPATVSKTVKKLKSGKTYYVRVRSFVKSGKTRYYSSWSKIKKVKVR